MVNLRTKIISCQTVGEELKSLLPSDFDMEMLEYGLHNVPKRLHTQRQEAIDSTGPEYATILIGYGLCANAVVGIKSKIHQIVIPKADDCITLFLGSRKEYLHQFSKAPGTYYLTKGWIECGEDPYTEYCAMREKYGHDKAYRVNKHYIVNYTRLALITSDNFDMEANRKYAKMVANYFDLTYEEISGSDELLKRFIQGEWEVDFVVVPPGEEVRYDMFYARGVRHDALH
jgi:hypothetical protein